VSPVLAAASRWRRPWPKTISTGMATAAASATTLPATTTATGQPGAATSVHQGTPNSSATISPTSAGRLPGRRAARAGGRGGGHARQDRSQTVCGDCRSAPSTASLGATSVSVTT
jgi:hypothetical protein